MLSRVLTTPRKAQKCTYFFFIGNVSEFLTPMLTCELISLPTIADPVLPQVAQDRWGQLAPPCRCSPGDSFPAPGSPAWIGLRPQAGRPPLTALCCIPLSDYSWPGQSQALTGRSRSEERVRTEKEGEGGRDGREGVRLPWCPKFSPYATY